ncbi:MAG: type II toxin-antitoxin system HipA family toxin [Burkholderiales bacterium]
MTSEKQAYVYIQLPGTMETVPAALLKVETSRDGSRVGRFRYGDRYLERADAFALDPFELPLDKTVREFTKLGGLPGAVRDAGPDSWGRRVIESKLQRSPADFDELDYLLHGPQDGAGNLAFGLGATPPAPLRRYNRTHQLAELIAAAELIEEGRRVPEYVLEGIEPGTSLGGARPKATVEDDNRLWLAKFPEKMDRFNMQRVEFATLLLARRCGLDVCNARLANVGGRDVLMLERFDRQRAENGYLRLGLVSGLTMLGAEDNYLDRGRWSYPLLADNLRRWSDRPQRDCRELFRRMVFNAAVTNNDDHPRNHAAIRSARGWRLSPAYDLVPTPAISQERRDLALTVGSFGRIASIYNLLSESGRFGLSIDEARKEIESIAVVVKTWREIFHTSGVEARDIETVAGAFLPACFFFESALDN